jgi:hypothetical protein
MSVQIILKYGNGEPAAGELAMGEVGVDISGKSLWTYNGKNNIQLAGGDIDLGQLPDVDIGGGIYVDLGELALIVGTNQEDITKLKLDVAANTTDIGLNTAAIATLSSKVAALELWQKDHEAAVGNLLIALGELEARVEVNEGGIETNKTEIAKLWAEIGLIEGGLSFAGTYKTSINLIETVTTYAADKGITTGMPLSSALGDGTKGLYFIAMDGGTLQNSGGTDDGKTVYPGDWLVCDGTKYLLLNYQLESTSFGQISGDPYENEKLGLALDAKISRDGDVIEGGVYAPETAYVNRNK